MENIEQDSTVSGILSDITNSFTELDVNGKDSDSSFSKSNDETKENNLEHHKDCGHEIERDLDYNKIAILNPKFVSHSTFITNLQNTKLLFDALTTKNLYMKASLQSFYTKAEEDLQMETENFDFQSENLYSFSPMSTNCLIENFVFENGVMTVIGKPGEVFLKCPISFSNFVKDYKKLLKLSSNGPLKTFCFNRLGFLKNQFDMHRLLNSISELNELKSSSHKDFYNIRKVDTHIHASSCMNQKHLQRFIKTCLIKNPNELVMVNKTTKKPMSLKEVFEEMDLADHQITVDRLDVHCDHNSFHRFDTFNSKYNPAGHPDLRDVFLKTDNYIKGKYFAEIIKEVTRDIEDSKYQYSELRLSIYGKKIDEWDKLATWFVRHNVQSPSVKWMIQIPRIYDIFKATSAIKSFQDIITNFFLPLFEVSKNPESHPELNIFLSHISGFDSVDDESKPEAIEINKSNQTPEHWTFKHNPSYAYYLYYMYANMTVLNQYRKSKGLSSFNFRPHCGEAGSPKNLAAAFLVADGISHGVLLRKSPVMQYLYYLCQMGIAMSPLSNNFLFLEYNRNPFFDYFCRGLNVSLSTDDPLQFHFTREPLMEEYSMATQIWKLSSTDMCELAKNSVLMSGFCEATKHRWLGSDFKKEGLAGNNILMTNVPNIRISYRFETISNELKLLKKLV